MAEGAGDASGVAAGVKPGALTLLLQEVAAAPEQREVEPPSLRPGTVIGRFEVLREVGRGAFGVVYEARDRDLGRVVALKIVRPGRVREEEGKVVREAEAIARLAHPNLVTLHDVGRSESGPYLVFEFLRGKTLQERIDEGPMPVREAVHVATEVARGLAHAHSEGVVHRDLKPSNVFVTTKGQVKILDFGMAHAFGRRRISGGTPAYMAPEQWEDAPEDERTDVFALGVMLYRMLGGEYPHPEGQGRWAAEPTTVRKLDVPGVPELADLVEKMLDASPTRRPRDGAAVLAALSPIDESLRARPADGSPPVHAKRRKVTLGDLLLELRRRHVFRVMIGYGVFAVAVLQVTEPIMHAADLPEWVLKAVLVALVLGFPVAVVLAWIFDLTAQGVKRTPSVAAPGVGRLERSRFLLPLAFSAAVLAVAAAGGGAWYAWRHVRERARDPAATLAAGQGGRISIAVADFANQTGQPELDALSGLLITSLEQSRKLAVLTRSRMFDLAREAGDVGATRIDEILGRKVSRRAGARVLLVPTVHRLGSTYAVELRALDPGRDEYLFTAREQSATLDGLLSVIDRLSMRTQRELGSAPPESGPGSLKVASALTPKVDAYAAYFRALSLLAESWDLSRAQASLREALAIDPGFSLAHLALAWLGDGKWVSGEDVGEHLAAVRGLEERLPEKERLLLSVLTARNPDESRAATRQLADRFPDDKMALLIAGHSALSDGQTDLALGRLERVLELDPALAPALFEVIPPLAGVARSDDALAIARRAVAARPGPLAHAALGMAHAARGEKAEAMREARIARDLGGTQSPRASVAIGRVLAFGGDLAGAEAALQGWSNCVEAPCADALAELAATQMSQGRLGEARRLAQKLRSVSPESVQIANGILGGVAWLSGRRAEAARSWQGMYAPLRAYLGDGDGARSSARALPSDSWRLDFYRGILAWQAGDRDAGVAHIRRGLAKDRNHAQGHYWIAEMMVEAGRYPEAIVALESFLETYQPHYSLLWHVFRPNALLLLARSQDAVGNRAAARSAVDVLLSDLRHADPDLPILAEAKATRARLAVEPPGK